LDEQFNKYQPRTADERAAMEQKYAVGEAFTKRTVQDLQVGGSNAKIVTLPGASTYIFLSNEKRHGSRDAFFHSYVELGEYFSISNRRLQHSCKSWKSGRHLRSHLKKRGNKSDKSRSTPFPSM
jgi:hypothetical protein